MQLSWRHIYARARDLKSVRVSDRDFKQDSRERIRREIFQM